MEYSYNDLDSECPECGRNYQKKGAWQKTCGPCYYRKKEEAEAHPGRQGRQGYQGFKEAPPKQTAELKLDVNKDFLRKLVMLCHPDKHGGSAMATEVTQQLLRMRDKL